MGRPRRGVKKSGSVKKSAANFGRNKLKSESVPRTSVGRDNLTPNSKSKYHVFHNKRRDVYGSDKAVAGPSRRLFGPEVDVTLACEDDNKVSKTGGGDAQPFSFGVKDFYSSGNYFFKEKVTPRSKPKPLPSTRERRSQDVDNVGRGRGKPPLNGEAAMTPEELKERKKGLQQLVRNKLKLRQVRQLARSSRKDSLDTANDQIEEDSDELIEDNVGGVDVGIGEASQNVPLSCEDDNNGSHGDDSSTTTSDSTLYRRETCFKSILPATFSDQLALMFSFVKQSEPFLSFLKLKCCDVEVNSLPFSQSDSTFFRKKSEIKNFIQKENVKYPQLVKIILRNWAQEVASSNLSYFMEYISFSDKSFLSKNLQVQLVYKEILTKLMKGRGVVTRPFFVKLSIELAKQIFAKEISHGDVSLLARTLGSNRKWAKKVLENVSKGTEENLTSRHRICMVPWSRRGEAHFRRRGTFKE